MAMVEAMCVLLVAVGTVAVLEVVNVKVHLSSKVSSLKSPLHSLFLAMVDANRDAFHNIDTSLEDVIGTVLIHLVVIARDVFARDALDYWDLHEEVDITVTSTGMPSIWSLP